VLYAPIVVCVCVYLRSLLVDRVIICCYILVRLLRNAVLFMVLFPGFLEMDFV
jgi:hypothetical protein